MTKLSLNNRTNIDTVKKAVKYCFADYPRLQELTVAQAILEAGLLLDKPSKLALTYNNLFGMKPGKIFARGTLEPDGIINMMTMECDKYHCYKIPQPFLANEEIEDSFYQHEQLFRRLDRYKALFTAQTFIEAATRVQEARYATDRAYTKKLISIYNSYIV